MRIASQRSRVALLATLALALFAIPRRGDAAAPAKKPVAGRKVSLVPLFDTNKRFKPKTTFKLQFRAKEKGSGAPVALDDISFSLRHGPGDSGTQLPARELKQGIFEVPFTPPGPGQYAVAVSIRGAAASIPPVRLGVVGLADGLVEEPPQADVDARRKARKLGKRR
ncbi:MAG: hypothetical protein ACJ79H_11400 [Myxococcales bacterium]